MWFKNLQLYRINASDLSIDEARQKLADLSLQPLTGLEMQTSGWVAPRGDDTCLIREVNGQWLLAFATQKKLLPAAVINQVLRERVEDLEQREGFKPGRKRQREMKEDIIDELLPRAFSVVSKVMVWLSPSDQLCVVDSASEAKTDEVLALLVRTFPGWGFKRLKTRLMPSVAMTNWLVQSDCPSGFSIDQDCELKAKGDAAGAVRYVKHPLDFEEINKHIQSGKEVSKLALTFNDRLSFLIQEPFQVKRFSALDVVKEQAQFDTDDDSFDAEFALLTLELKQFLPALLEALGGELDRPDELLQKVA